MNSAVQCLHTRLLFRALCSSRRPGLRSEHRGEHGVEARGTTRAERPRAHLTERKAFVDNAGYQPFAYVRSYVVSGFSRTTRVRLSCL